MCIIYSHSSLSREDESFIVYLTPFSKLHEIAPRVPIARSCQTIPVFFPRDKSTTDRREAAQTTPLRVALPTSLSSRRDLRTPITTPSFPAARESRSYLEVTKLSRRASRLKQYWRGPTGVRPVVHIRYLFKAARHGRFATHSPWNSAERVPIRTRARTRARERHWHRYRESSALSTPNSKCWPG